MDLNWIGGSLFTSTELFRETVKRRVVHTFTDCLASIFVFCGNSADINFLAESLLKSADFS